jgi:hypothetical protein
MQSAQEKKPQSLIVVKSIEHPLPFIAPPCWHHKERLPFGTFVLVPNASQMSPAVMN